MKKYHSLGITYSSVDDIVGQSFAKRAIEICAAGGHNLMLSGSPGVGKSMLAKSTLSLLPSMSAVELSELRKIYSYVGKDLDNLISRPFRSPHHTISYAGMLGGGHDLLPGEVTLSHNGVLFMDEFCEFSRNVLESLRQPLQDGYVNLTRNNMTYVFPSRFTLIGATNPCPCGYLGHPTKQCTCTEQKISSYLRKLSGPLLDRFDLYVNIFPENNFFEKISENTIAREDNSKRRVETAHATQIRRLNLFNAFMSNYDVKNFCRISKDASTLLNQAVTSLKLSPRAYFKILKVARTIADIDQFEIIYDSHIAEALQYRPR
jgi:magnesium chelatase family protein